MFVRHLYVFFGEMSVSFSGPFFDWIVYSSGIELRKLLVSGRYCGGGAVAQLGPTHDPMDCIRAGFSVQGILQARILEWVCHFLLQGIFPTQGSKLQISYQILIVASRHELFNQQ